MRTATRTFMELELNLLEMYDMMVRCRCGACVTNINSNDDEPPTASVKGALAKTGRTIKRAVIWANRMAGPAANMEAPNWYTCVGTPEMKEITLANAGAPSLLRIKTKLFCC